MNVWGDSRNSMGPDVALEDAQLGVSDPDSWAEIELGLPYWLALSPVPGASLILL